MTSLTTPNLLPCQRKNDKMTDSIKEEIDELRRKLALLGMCLHISLPILCFSTSKYYVQQIPSSSSYLDGDQKAYAENSGYSIEQNKEKIAKLRSENKELRTKLANRMKVSICV